MAAGPYDLTVSINAVPNTRSVNTAVQQMQNQLATGRVAADSFGDSLVLKGRNFLAYSAAAAAVAKFTAVIGRATRDAIKFDFELAKIAQTTNLSRVEINKHADDIRKMSVTYGFSAVKIAETVRVLAQAGFSLREAKQGADSLAGTTLLSTFNSIADTTDGLIAITKQFNGTMADSAKILGILNVVSKKYAVESSDLIEGVRKAGGVFAATGGNLEQLVALFTTVRDTTRESAETIGTGLRTIFSKIQRPKSIEFFKQYGVSLTDLKGDFIGNFEAIQRIQKGLENAKIKPGSIAFAQIVEQLGGLRQASKVIPLLTQQKKLADAYADASAGTNQTATDIAKAQETISVRISVVQQEFSKLISEITETTSFKLFLDVVLGIADGFIKIAQTVKQILPLLGVFAAFSAGRALVGATAGGGKGPLAGIARLFLAKGGVVPQYFAGGGEPRGTDTVPAMLTPGEFVLNKDAAKTIGYSRLQGINKKPQYLADGGIVGAASDSSGSSEGVTVSMVAFASLSIQAIVLGKSLIALSGAANKGIESMKSSAAQRVKATAKREKISNALLDIIDAEEGKRIEFVASIDNAEKLIRAKLVLLEAKIVEIDNSSDAKTPAGLNAKQRLRGGIQQREEHLSNIPRMRHDALTQDSPREKKAKNALNVFQSRGISKAPLITAERALGGFAAAVVVANAVLNSLSAQQEKLTQSAIENGSAIEAEAASRAESETKFTLAAVGSLAATGASVGAAIGTFVLPAVGTALGGAVGGVVGVVAGLALQAEVLGSTVRDGAKGFADFGLGLLGFQTFGEAADAAAKEAKELAQANRELRVSNDLSESIEAQINTRLLKSFIRLEIAANKAAKISELGDLVASLSGGNFRSSSLSSGVERGDTGAIISAGKISGASAAGAEVAKFSSASTEFKKAKEEFAATGDLKKFQAAVQSAADSADIVAGDLMTGLSTEALEKVGADLEAAGSKARDVLSKTAKDLEDGFNKYLDSISRASDAQIEYNQSLIDFGDGQRGRRKDLEGFKASGSSLADIKTRRSTIDRPISPVIRQDTLKLSSNLTAKGLELGRAQKRGQNVSSLSKLGGDFAALQIATKAQVSLIKQDIQVREQLITSLKEELSLEQGRAKSLEDITFLASGAAGSEAADAAKQTLKAAAALERAAASGGGVKALGRASNNGENAQELLGLLGPQQAENIRRQAANQGAQVIQSKIGGNIGAEARTVADTGFTEQGKVLVKGVAKQGREQTKGEAVILQVQQDNLILLQESARLLQQSVGSMAGHFTNFGEELKTIVSSLKDSSISMTMTPLKVSVSLSDPKSLQDLREGIDKTISEKIKEAFAAKEQGR